MCSYDFREITQSSYFINNIIFSLNITFYKDLVIMFENNLIFNKNIGYICKKKHIFYEFNF